MNNLPDISNLGKNYSLPKKLDDYRQDFKNTDFKVVKKSIDFFWKLMTIFLFIVVLAFGTLYFYFMESGKLNTDVSISPMFNPEVTSNTNNQYAFSPQTNNSYEINLNLDSDIIDRICNATN